jgi:hypothetical protein
MMGVSGRDASPFMLYVNVALRGGGEKAREMKEGREALDGGSSSPMEINITGPKSSAGFRTPIFLGDNSTSLYFVGLSHLEDLLTSFLYIIFSRGTVRCGCSRCEGKPPPLTPLREFTRHRIRRVLLLCFFPHLYPLSFQPHCSHVHLSALQQRLPTP